MSNQLRIDEVYLFTSEDADGNEGVCAFEAPGGVMLPMVCADAARVDSLRQMAKLMKARSGMKIKLLKFSKRSFVEEI